MKSTVSNHWVIPFKFLCVYFNVLLLAVCLAGCMKAPDILDQEPVIPLTADPQEKKEEPYPSLHLSGNREETKSESHGTEEPAEPVSVNYKRVSGNGVNNADAVADPEEAVEPDTARESVKKDDGDYQVEGVQLSEKQLEKMSAYFNLKDVNPYLQQVYLIPEDFNKNAANDPVNITCVAGSYDSNRLYSIFYKKEGSNDLWNVVLRRRDPGQDGEDGDPGSPQETYEIKEDVLTDGNYRFHSNRMLAPDSKEIK